MAFNNPSNQLLQIDTGNALTYLFNPSLSNVPLYANLGENQVLGQRYFATVNATAVNPSGAPAIYMLVKYSSTAQPSPSAAPAPVYWTDETFTTVSGVSTESLGGLNLVAGYLLPNTASISGLTAAMLQGAYVLIQVGGLLQGAVAPGSGTLGVGNTIIAAAGNFSSAAVAAGTAPGYEKLGIQLTAASNGLCDVLVKSPDII